MFILQIFCMAKLKRVKALTNASAFLFQTKLNINFHLEVASMNTAPSLDTSYQDFRNWIHFNIMTINILPAEYGWNIVDMAEDWVVFESQPRQNEVVNARYMYPLSGFAQRLISWSLSWILRGDPILFYQILRSVVAIVGLLELMGVLLELKGNMTSLLWWVLSLNVLSSPVNSVQLLHYVCLSYLSYLLCNYDIISSTYMYLSEWELPQPEVNMDKNLTSSSSNREKWGNIVY